MLGTLLMGMGAGAGLMLLLDPGAGARRRALVRDKLAHGSRVLRAGVGTASRDLGNRARGTMAVLQQARQPDEASDDVLVERVRAKLGRVVSRMRAIEVTARDGVVTLAGPILAAERTQALATTMLVKGVVDVSDELQPHEDPGDVPALQGGSAASPLGFFGRRSAPGIRALVGTAGAALATWGVARRGRAGLGLALAGAGLGARAFRGRRR